MVTRDGFWISLSFLSKLLSSIASLILGSLSSSSILASSISSSSSKGLSSLSLLSSKGMICILLIVWFPSLVDCDFNYEVEKRVLERIHDFMDGPVTTNSLTERYFHGGGFVHDMEARDRDMYLTYAYTYMQEYTFDMVYYGLEDGLFVGYGRNWGTYREPRDGGYNISNIQLDLDYHKYFYSCTDRQTGESENCTMASGNKYVQCIDDCSLKVCNDQKSQFCYDLLHNHQPNSNNNNTNANHSLVPSECQQTDSIKWCPQYDILSAPSTEQLPLGYIPRFYHCHDPNGKFTQQVGHVLQGDGTIGNCYYGDRTTLVSRTQLGDYAYCNKNGGKCNALIGAYRSRDYDPRYRTWYLQTKETQRPNWSPPYPFFSNLELGITYSHPLYHYDTTKNQTQFFGVLAVDYSFGEISNFLLQSYFNTSTSILVYEKEEPNYVVASSTGLKAAQHVLHDDPTQPCPDVTASDNNCDVVRTQMSTLGNSSMERLLQRAYQRQKDQGYPRELVSVKGSDQIDSQVYISQSSLFTEGNLEWIILVISPAKDNDKKFALTIDDSLFGVVCFIAVLGISLCLLLFTLFYWKRRKRAVVVRDWRFTCAFIMGCALMNISSLTMLGPNTDALCMTRMWSFHLFYVIALSPLFVKIWRIRVLTESSMRRRRCSVTNQKAAAYTLPFILIQAFILLFFSIFDPPKQTELISIDEGIVTHQIICQQKSVAFVVIQMILEAGLVFLGCLLAYLTRNLSSDFSEARELMFSMYNIGFIGVTTAVVIFAMEIDATGQIVCMAMGIFWGTVFSSAVFVLPRLMQVKEDEKLKANAASSDITTSIVFPGQAGAARQLRISGLDPSIFLSNQSQNNNDGSIRHSSASFRLQTKNDELCLIREDSNSGDRSDYIDEELNHTDGTSDE